MAGKKGKKDKEAKKVRMAEKSKKLEQKAAKSEKKKAKKLGDDDEDEQDIDEILAQFRKEQEAFEKVTIEPVERPIKRINGSMVASPVHGKRELLLFGGESVKTTPQGSLSTFYNDLYSYSIDSDHWRKITSPNSPLPRSGHAMCVHPSGIILLFGGEFSSPKQSTFYHYGDTWVLDAQTKEWMKVENKKSPLARSGHRMTYWKNYVLLHGGFRDLSASTTYMNDLWAFDVTSYKWHQIELPQTMSIPEPRSGHSFLPTAEGAALYGGYSKVKGTKKGMLRGKVHQDSWLLKMKGDLKGVSWERRKKSGFAPSPRVGCSLVSHRGRGVLFGGVYDTEETEESLQSTFFNQLYAFQIESNRWFTLSLRKRKAPVIKKDKEVNRHADLEENLSKLLDDKLQVDSGQSGDVVQAQSPDVDADADSSDDDREKREYPIVNTLPHARFNATLAVVDDQLFIYGGVWENGEREYNLDSMYSVDLGKLDGIKVYWEDLKELEEPLEGEEDEDDDLEGDEDDDDEFSEFEDEDDEDLEEEEEEEEEEPIDKDDPRPWLAHPKPFETLRAFYERAGADFVDWALKQDPDARGKDLKKNAFDLCEDRWWERREEVRAAEDKWEALGGVADVVEKQERGKRR